ncbi:MAG TPA: hypothetical protein VIA18_27180 [Polyangia bacterium]|jgi:hypothetical protein|nr:hypothetical protein [Polyangia bacterium]HWE27986.1 hypothetical protein [Polyangia bacterium]
MAHATKVQLFRWTALLGVMALLVVTFLAGRASAMPQPNMQAALGHLEQAKESLEHAEHNKGGFRAKAVQLTNEAIAATKEGIAMGNK